MYFIQLHSDIIRDVTFLEDSWPWCSGETTFVTASVDGHGKVSEHCIPGRGREKGERGQQYNCDETFLEDNWPWCSHLSQHQ